MLTTPDQLELTAMLFAIAVAVVDWRSHRIPNALCAVAAIIALSSQTLMHGEAGLLTALGGAAVGFAMFLPFYVVRAFGAGDVKAMATAGTFLGMQATVLAVGITLVIGAILGVAVLLFRRDPANPTWHRLMLLLSSPRAGIRVSIEETTAENRQRFPYGVAIACGTVITLLAVAH